MAAGFQCARCGEWNETVVQFVDQSAGSRQSYVEDCQVCCKPNLLAISWESNRYVIHAELES